MRAVAALAGGVGRVKESIVGAFRIPVFQVIDSEGFRANVGIILTNAAGQVFWARRLRQNAWQFPQGGIGVDETPEEAMYRELGEEVGLAPEDVILCGCTGDWLHYRLPRRLVRRNHRPVCVGQKQLWYMLRVVEEEPPVRLDATDHPEFDTWRWVDYWRPARDVVYFKRRVYARALSELAGMAPRPPGPPPRDVRARCR